jgi:hypothetical protein
MPELWKGEWLRWPKWVPKMYGEGMMKKIYECGATKRWSFETERSTYFSRYPDMHYPEVQMELDANRYSDRAREMKGGPHHEKRGRGIEPSTYAVRRE